MPFDDRNLDDYVDVNQRIADFRELHPAGFLQPLDQTDPYRIVTIECHWCRACIGRRTVKDRGNWKTCTRCQGTGLRGADEPAADTFIVCVAAAYRDPDDTRPGVGMAWEPYPGQTPYTLGSELMNAETSAWGRAIVAVLASDSKRGIASREEVRNRRGEQEEPPPAPEPERPKRTRSTPERAAGNLPRNTDGSVSRSRTTDAELAATGQMTDAQLRDHNRLERDTKGTGPQGTQRLTTTPADDPWYEESTGIVRQPRPSPHFAGVIHAHFKRLGFTDEDKPQRLKVMSQLTGRDITSTNDLTAAEGLTVKAFLEGCKNKAALIEKLVERQQEAGDG